MADLDSIRAEIDALDGELAKLFAKRLALAEQAAAAKRASGVPIADAGRERDVLARVARVDPARADDLRLLWTHVIAVSRAREERGAKEGR